MGEMSFDGGGDEGEGVATLLAACLDYRQHRFHEATAGGALRSKRQLPPDHRMTQRPLARIVRRLHPFAMQKRPEPWPMFVQLPTCAAHASIATLHSAQQQTLDFAANRTHPTQQCRPRDFTGAIIGPMFKQLACRASQTLSEPFRARIARVDHRLEIAPQMRPAPLQSSHSPVHFRPVAGISSQ